ncbi:MAG: ATP-dependent sacrificial sulfur transferase LarE [Clostridioides sp.]|jgi:uncharacterized protein|nr:ATP-dependent sacrificial sulfur transferase LarE [Clostridioides sp.]
MENEDKLLSLNNYLKKLKKVAIAYSGGVDSNFLLNVAKNILGENVIAITIDSPLQSRREIEAAKEYSKKIGVKHIILKIDDLNIDSIIENNERRCYFCKTYVFTKIKEIASQNNIDYVLDGTNLDDMSDYRPGLKALEELEILSPLKECGFRKLDIREISKEMGLETYNKPSFACLASRIPYGTSLNKKTLDIIDKSEAYLEESGFSQFRVRVHGDIARIEILKEEMYKLFSEYLFEKIERKLKEYGFKYVTVDLNGYKMGSMNTNIKNRNSEDI